MESKTRWLGIEAVETFVDHPYAGQIEWVERHDPDRVNPPLQALRTHLQACRGEEVAHRDGAAALFARCGAPPSAAPRTWVWAVAVGSRVAANICHRV